MAAKILFQMIFLCTIALICGNDTDAQGKAEGNVWDMLIAQDLSNDGVTFERAPGYSRPLAAYGPPAPVYAPAPVPIASASNFGFSAGGSISPGGVLRPQVEILKLVENFLKLKGEIGARFYAVVVDNWDLIRTVYNTVIANVGSLHAFTVNGIIILRKILEFAVALFGNWQITVPSVNVDLSTLFRETDFNNI